jgi:hypothetical protein
MYFPSQVPPELGCERAVDDVEEGLGEEWGVVEAGGAVEAQAERAGALGEGDVDVVEDLDVVGEEADGL